MEEQIEELVANIVRATLRNEGLDILAHLQPQQQQPVVNNEDAQLNQRFGVQPLENINTLSRVPDIVNSIPVFDGRNNNFFVWKEQVDRVLYLYSNVRNSPEYVGIMSVLRGKIVGDASAILVTQGTPLDWAEIVATLSSRFADKRDCKTLQFQMYNLKQGNKTYEQFYSEINNMLFLIRAKISEGNDSRETVERLFKTYEEMAVEVFIRGVGYSMANYLELKEPSSLNSALELCRIRLSRHGQASGYGNGNPAGDYNAHSSRKPTAHYQHYNDHARNQNDHTRNYNDHARNNNDQTRNHNDHARNYNDYARDNRNRNYTQAGQSYSRNNHSGGRPNADYGTGQASASSNNSRRNNPFSQRREIGGRDSRSSSMEPMEVDNSQYARALRQNSASNSSRSNGQHVHYTSQERQCENAYDGASYDENDHNHFLGQRHPHYFT